MRITNAWKDYELLDCSDGERLERWGDIILIRPDPQVIWKTKKNNKLWYEAHARYHRSNTGGGSWQFYKKIPEVWQIKFNDLEFNLKPMSFKHTGVFPEQACNWELVRDIIKNSGRDDVKVLNLFAYTGAATVSALKAGASVVHVDASKGMVQWARENATSSGVADKPVRWIVDDCMKFVAREIRREKKYDIIIMDPPSYGRGPGGEVWKLENEVYGFIEMCKQVLSDDPLAILVNSYTAGLSPAVMSYILNSTVVKDFGGKAEADEIGLNVSENGLVLPCGSTAVWMK
ncbi:MAG: class I SAM-dependent methyltransferase [Clostridia bacterium]|nr:class I SAM-dependent methyltransferase [Clostridia bacterium]